MLASSILRARHASCRMGTASVGGLRGSGARTGEHEIYGSRSQAQGPFGMTEEQISYLLADVPVRSLLATDWYELDICDRNYRSGVSRRDTFELFSRQAPFGGAYMVCAGTVRALTYLLFALTREEADWLVAQGLSREFANYLLSVGRTLFRGVDIWIVEEGRLVFPYEPIMRVEGPSIPVQLLETYALNAVNYSTLVATKAARMRQAAGERPVLLEFGMRRAQDLAHLVAARCAMIGGLDATSNTYASRIYGTPPRGSVMHSQIQRYSNEVEAFRALYRSALDKNRVVFLLDTYDTRQGIKNAITVAREMRAEGHELYAVRLDSGDLAALSREVRQALRDAGFGDVRIILSGDLNEERISALVKAGAEFDVLGLGTELVTCSGQPALPGVYKMTATSDPETGGTVGRMKLSNDPGKATLPGAHQVYRFYAPDGSMVEDVIGLDPDDDELASMGGEPLLRRAVRDGEIVLPVSSPSEMLQNARRRAALDLSRLPERYRALKDAPAYSVRLSQRVDELRREMIRETGAAAEGEPLEA
ncbi:MAG: nicotinate phosphoribosyltransferase [Armatimonadota bacterium]